MGGGSSGEGGSGWYMNELHLKGAFDGYNGTGGIPKRMMVGPRPWPLRPWAGYHYEMLRWYDHWLKGMDTRVMEGPPIQLYVQGENAWRSESEWPLKRTQWREFYLGGAPNGHEGKLLDSAGSEQTRHVPVGPVMVPESVSCAVLLMVGQPWAGVTAGVGVGLGVGLGVASGRDC